MITLLKTNNHIVLVHKIFFFNNYPNFLLFVNSKAKSKEIIGKSTFLFIDLYNKVNELMLQ